MNKVILKGYITKDIELRYTKNDVAVARFTVGIKRPTKNKDGNYDSDFINCVAYQHNAELISKFFEKGSSILVEGHIQTGSYENDKGQKIYTTDVMVERVEFVSKKVTTEEKDNTVTIEFEKPTDEQDDVELPF